MASRIMSDAEIRRRKKGQAILSETTGALGLAALGGTLAASRRGRTTLRKIPKLKEKVAAPKPKDPNRDKIKDATTPILATAAGLGGIGSFNFGAYTNAESRKRPRPVQPVKKNNVFENEGVFGEIGKSEDYISKIGEWKTIDQREQTQRRDRKAMRAAGAGAGVGAGLVALGYHDAGDKHKYKAAGHLLKDIKENHASGAVSTKDSLKTAGKGAKAVGGALSHSGKIGVGMLGTAAAVGAGAKTHHTYHQHKINERRRHNFKKNATSAFGVVHE